MHEGDWWDNDPRAPWNQDDPPEPESGIEYKPADQPFEISASVSDDLTLLKKKSDNSLWVMDTVDMLDTDGEFDAYIYYINYDDDQSEKAEDMEDESYLNIATDLYKNKEYIEDPTIEDWENKYDKEPYIRLFKINEPLAAHLLEHALYWKKRRDQKYYPKKPNPGYKDIVNLLARAYPEIDF